MAKDKEDLAMHGRTKWLLGGALALGLLLGSIVASGVSAQATPTSGMPGAGSCPGPAMMGAGFGGGAAMGAFGRGMAHDAASALGMTSQELADAQASGKSVATLAQERNVDLSAVVEAALAAHAAQLDAAVTAGALTQAQADSMTAFMKARLEHGLQGSPAAGPRGFGMMGGHGMMGPGFGPPWRTTP